MHPMQDTHDDNPCEGCAELRRKVARLEARLALVEPVYERAREMYKAHKTWRDARSFTIERGAAHETYQLFVAAVFAALDAAEKGEK